MVASAGPLASPLGAHGRHTLEAARLVTRSNGIDSVVWVTFLPLWVGVVAAVVLFNGIEKCVLGAMLG
jgi:hypothetical protein